MPFNFFGKLWKSSRAGDVAPPPGARPRHLGDLWPILQEIAREEDPEVFERKPVHQHAAESVEGKKDVERWLHVYLGRVRPDHAYRFPAHHARHRGHCLIPRQWPDGTVWEAFDEETLLKARVPAQPSRAELVRRLDAWLEEREENDDPDERER